MARRNQNAFLKRQKELKRLRKAQEKMARRHGKKIEDLNRFEGPPPPLSQDERPAAPDGNGGAGAAADEPAAAPGEDENKD